MNNLQLKTSYSVNLFHFVDSISQWDHFVSPHIRSYFEENWKVSRKDYTILEKYAVARKKYGWDSITEILEWAYNAFPLGSEYSILKKYINHFEFLKDKNGIPLRKQIKDILPEIEKAINHIEKEYQRKEVEKVFVKMKSLFNSQDIANDIPTYILYSYKENSSCGNADGKSIYIEVPKGENYAKAYQILIHELAHKIVYPREYFQKNASKTLRELSQKTYPNIYKDELCFFFEEVVVYALCEIYLFGYEPVQKIDHMKSNSLWGNQAKQSFIHIWRLAGKVESEIRKYLENNLDRKDTLKHIEKSMIDYVGAYTS
jgi:hypothetical protein